MSIKLIGQSDSITGPFVKLKNGKLLFGKEVKFTEKLIGKKIIVDGKEITPSTISIFRNTQNELYGNTSAIAAIFRKSFYSANDADFFMSGSAGTENRGTLLFSHKLGPVKIVSATSLKNLMKSDSIANDMVRRANVFKSVCNISLLTAAGLLGFSLTKTFSAQRIDRNTEAGIDVLGSGCIIMAIIANGAKKRKARAAIKRYYGIEIE